MKKFLVFVLALTALSSLCVPAFAAGDAQTEPYTILVNQQPLDLSDLPVAPYQEGNTVMVPLRKIGEALGYKVDWDPEAQTVTIDDDYIQKATLFPGTSAVIFEGRLKVINMSRETENAAPTAVYSGYTYVPLTFFQEFFNDAQTDGSTITIAPSMCELATDL